MENATLKKAVEGKGDFAAEIWRFDAEPGVHKGGIIISAVGPDVEAIASEGLHASDAEQARAIDAAFIEAPPLYRAPRGHPWFAGVPLTGIIGTDGNMYSPDYRIRRSLLERNNGTFNASVLRAVGLADGVQFKIADLYPVTDLKVYLQLLKTAAERIHNEYFKKYRLRLRVPSGPASHVA